MQPALILILILLPLTQPLICPTNYDITGLGLNPVIE